jgi:hypothetical protein
MRDLLNDLSEGLSHPDPIRRAQIQMKKPLPKRFYIDVAVAELLGSLGDDHRLIGSDLAVHGDDAGIEQVGSLVVEEAHALDALDFSSIDGASHSISLPLS